jgi:hypothetical protein
MTMLTIGTAVATAAAVAGGVQQYQQGQANAKLAKQEAAFEEDANRMRARQILAEQRVGYAKAGVTLEGSPLNVMEDTAAQAELDALAIRFGGRTKSLKYRSEGFEGLVSGVGQAGQALLTGYTAMSNAGYFDPKPSGPAYSQPGFKPPGIK